AASARITSVTRRAPLALLDDLLHQLQPRLLPRSTPASPSPPFLCPTAVRQVHGPESVHHRAEAGSTTAARCGHLPCASQYAFSAAWIWSPNALPTAHASSRRPLKKWSATWEAMCTVATVSEDQLKPQRAPPWCGSSSSFLV